MISMHLKMQLGVYFFVLFLIRSHFLAPIYSGRMSVIVGHPVGLIIAAEDFADFLLRFSLIATSVSQLPAALFANAKDKDP